ncbi:replication protein [Sodalis sp. RH22]|uniref:replication protein n=1 Tax=unclassified Sodalis (in: enterobacteria) TaxID=2636512 RepID=UPI0039B5A840
MENQKTGYVPLYRSVKKKPWAKDVFLRTLWDNLLLDAARQPFTADFKGHQWNLEPGQLVVTAADLGLSLCDRKGVPTSRDTVERMLAFFVKEGMISITGERRKGRLITILNYSEYAEKIVDLPAHNGAHKPAHISAHNKPSAGAASEGGAAHNGAHKPAQRTAHHEQEVNNKTLKPSSSRHSDECQNGPSEKFLAKHPEAVGGCFTPSGKLWGTADDLTAAKWIYARVTIVNASLPEPSWPSWANEVRLLRTTREQTHKQICEVFKWANGHHFWAANVLCPAKLRKQWDTLVTQKAQQPIATKTKTQELNWDNRDWADKLPPGVL